MCPFAWIVPALTKSDCAFRSNVSTASNSPADDGPHFWSITRKVRVLTFLTDSEIFSNMRSFTFSWSITGLLARRTQSADSVDSQELLFCYSKLTPPARASLHAKHGELLNGSMSVVHTRPGRWQPSLPMPRSAGEKQVSFQRSGCPRIVFSYPAVSVSRLNFLSPQQIRPEWVARKFGCEHW